MPTHIDCTLCVLSAWNEEVGASHHCGCDDHQDGTQKRSSHGFSSLFIVELPDERIFD
jgi:hypothetical protein